MEIRLEFLTPGFLYGATRAKSEFTRSHPLLQCH